MLIFSEDIKDRPAEIVRTDEKNVVLEHMVETLDGDPPSSSSSSFSSSSDPASSSSVPLDDLSLIDEVLDEVLPPRKKLKPN